MLKVFRTISLIEGITTLALFLVAMPMKYIWGMPKAVSIVGMIHGVAFMGYALAMVVTLWGRGWSASEWFRTAIAAVFPFGTFLNDPFLKRKELEEEGGNRSLELVDG